MARYGYCRVSTEGQDVQQQMDELKPHVIHKFFCDSYTGKTMDRPKYNAMCQVLKPGDTVLVTKLDRFTRSVSEGIAEIERLLNMGVQVDILNMGRIGIKPTERLVLTVLMAFAEFERTLILERTQTGRERARQNPDYREGRKQVYNEDQIKLALQLFDEGYTIREITRKTGVSKTTFHRRRKELKAKELIKK